MVQLIQKRKTQKIHGKKNYIERNQLRNLLIYLFLKKEQEIIENKKNY